jgi:ribose-phosphate pyrophosphokinase
MTISGGLAVIAGRSNPKLAADTARYAGVMVTPCDTHCHADGELYIEIGDNVRGQDVFVVQSTSRPGNDHLMELLIIIDALKRASAERINAVIPYFGYARQDRKNRPRQPITAKLVADLVTTAGAHRVLTIDLHAGQIMGFFNLPVDNLYARPVMLKYLTDEFDSRGLTADDLCVVSPDTGGVSRARAYAKRLDAALAIIDKRRSVPNQVAEMNVVGSVEGKVAVLVDDIVDTGGTLAMAADALLEVGAKEVIACCTHGVLSNSAISRLQASSLSKIVTSDTILQPELETGEFPKFIQLTVAPLLGEAIRRIHEETSVSSLFEEQN